MGVTVTSRHTYNVLLLKLSRQMALDECRLPRTTITHEHQLRTHTPCTYTHMHHATY